MRRLAAGLLLLVLLSTPVLARPLQIGDQAPALEAQTWLNGKAVNPAKPDGKTTYVVEFWATWCPPCKASIPHLIELQDKLKDRHVAVVGVSDEDPATVKPFVKQMKMTYLVGIDAERASYDSYMGDEPGIPTAFIVDTNGVVAWIGSPFDDLEKKLTAIIDGTFDRQAASEGLSIQRELRPLLDDEKFDEALVKVNSLLKKYPKQFDLYQIKLSLLAQTEQLDEARAVLAEAAAAFPDDADALSAIAWAAATAPFKMGDPAIAWKTANRAAELTGRKDPSVLDTLARASYACGLLSEAVTAEEEAVKLASGDDKAALVTNLAYYKAALAVRTGARKEEKP